MWVNDVLYLLLWAGTTSSVFAIEYLATPENPKIKACVRPESDVGADMIVCPKVRTHRFDRTFQGK